MDIQIYKLKRNKKHDISCSFKDIDFCVYKEEKQHMISFSLNDKQIAELMSTLWDYCFQKKKTIMKEYMKIRRK